MQTANDLKGKTNELSDSQFTCPFLHPSLDVAGAITEEIMRMGHRSVREWSASAVLAIGGALVVLVPHANAQTANSQTERPAYMNPALSADERP